MTKCATLINKKRKDNLDVNQKQRWTYLHELIISLSAARLSVTNNNIVQMKHEIPEFLTA